MSAEEAESALEALVQEHARTPTRTVTRKIEKLATFVVDAHAASAATAMREGNVLTAGTLWHRAYAWCAMPAPGAAEETCSALADAIAANQTALERAADDAARKRRWEPASQAYAVILLAVPDHATVAEKSLAAQKAFASSLQSRAKVLERKKLLGAAWAMNLRALEHDPMQSDAFRTGSSIERTMRARAKVALQDITVVAKKPDRAFADAIAAALRPRLDDVEPYGPTKDKAAAKATLTLKVVKVAQKDASLAGIDRRPVTGKNAKPGATWDLAYREVTRTVEATVRFELKESGVAAPVVVEITERLERTDRTHAGSKKRRVAADPLTLPSSKAMLAELAPRFGAGASVIATARDRRVQMGLVQAKRALARGRTDEALHAYVEVLFACGPDALPPDAAAFVARATGRDSVETLLAASEGARRE